MLLHKCLSAKRDHLEIKAFTLLFRNKTMKKQVKYGMHLCLQVQMAVVAAALCIKQERKAAAAKMETVWSPNLTLGLNEERNLSTEHKTAQKSAHLAKQMICTGV